ncbi:MAG: BON domain-containing protein [Pirellulaceae bacterium]|nr:BON domain-containing protein [Pirellulaceae bacterium]
MKKSLRFLVLASSLLLLAGICPASAHAQGGRSGSTQGGSGSTFNGMSTGGSSGGGTSGSSSSLFNSGSGSSSSLFNSGSSSTGSSSGGSSSGGSGVTTSPEFQTEINTGQIGAATPIQRGEVLSRDGRGANLISSNYDIIGGQSAGGGNQFANLFSQIGRSMNQGGNFNQQGGRNAARSTIRIPLRLGFAPKPVSIPQFTAKFESRIAKLPAISAIGPIRVTMEGSTAVLTGVVAAEEDRQLAEGVALLEPEVETVRNELTVQTVETPTERP